MPTAELRSQGKKFPLFKDINAQNDRLRKLNEAYLQQINQDQREQVENFQLELRALIDQIEDNGFMPKLSLDNPANPALNAIAVSLSPERRVQEDLFDRRCELLFAKRSEDLEGMSVLRQQVVESHAKLAPTNQESIHTARLVLSISHGLVPVGGLSILIDRPNSSSTAEKQQDEEDKNQASAELNRLAELTGLLFRAATNQPVDAARYNISPERFAALRQAMLAAVSSQSEEQYWEQLAQAAEAGYGANANPYTLGDHFYALDLAFTWLEALIEPQPCELDLGTWMPALHEAWQSGEKLKADSGVPRLYRSITSVVTDDSGATKLTRLFLARAALAQVAELENQSTPGLHSAKPRLGSGGSSWNALYQISNAAALCLPEPYVGLGMLTNTILGLMFGTSDSSNYLDAFSTTLTRIDKDVHQIKDTQLSDDLGKIKDPIGTYNQRVSMKWAVSTEDNDDDNPSLPDIDFFDREDDPSSLRRLLESSFNDENGLYHAIQRAEAVWSERKLRDAKGEWGLLSYLLLAYTTYLNCSRQLASTYAMIANLRGQTNHQDLLDPTWTGGHRPDPRKLLTSDGDSNALTRWTGSHWDRVSDHIKLVKSIYEWPESLNSHRSLADVRIKIISKDFGGYYDKTWFTMIDLWRRAEVAASRPVEIYRYTISFYFPAAIRFAHGWPASRRVADQFCEIYADDDLLPPPGSINTPGTQQWLLQWYKDLSDLHKDVWFNDQTERITAESQSKIIACLEPAFLIGIHNPPWTYFLLQTIRKQLQRWRLNTPVAINPNTPEGQGEVDRLHGAAWPTSGELSRIIDKLDQALPCSWSDRTDYLWHVLESLKSCWTDMAHSGADPSRISWMQGEKYWWRDRRNADQRPMPLLPETIALILEVWLAGAIRADRLQRPIREGDAGSYKDTDLIQRLNDNYCELKATAANEDSQHPDAYAIPGDLAVRKDTPLAMDFDKAFYDAHRDEIHDAWVATRASTVDALCEPFGLMPSKPDLSPAEMLVQNWLNGLLDESLNDDLKLQKPTKLIEATSEPGLGKPSIKDASMWQEGALVSYSYQLRGLSSFQASGNDHLSEESALSDPVILDAETAQSGMAIKIPRDELLLARQFMLYRTITLGVTTSKLSIGSGHFDPGQLEPALFHDGNPPTPKTLETSNISVAHESKPPKDADWIPGNFVRYGLQYLDSNGRNIPSESSALSEPFRIDDPNFGLSLTIPSDDHGIATSVQVTRQILDQSQEKVVAKLKVIAKHTFPISDHPGLRTVEILDADLSPAPAPVVFSLHMSQGGLDLTRSDQTNPVWSSDPGRHANQDQTSCRMQGDGNLVVYNKDLRAYWSSDTMESAGQTNSQRALRLLPNGELAIVDSLKTGNVVKLIMAGDPKLPKDDRPAVYLRNGDMMLPGQFLSIDNQSPQPQPWH